MEQLTPIEAEKRIVSLDVLRGVALLGILIVNMISFNTPLMYYQMISEIPWNHTVDQWVYYGIQFFAEGKFYTMFSFLFGVGFIIFMERAKEKQRKARLLFLRRLLILLAFGLLHAFFLWYGDILIMYALTGVLLLMFFNRKPKTLLVWAIILIVLSMVIVGLLIVASMALNNVDTVQLRAQNQLHAIKMTEHISKSYYAYGQGNFSEIMGQRVTDLTYIFTYFIFVIPMILPMFLLGAYIGKTRIIMDISSHYKFLSKIWIWSFVIGVPMTVMKVYSQMRTSYEMISYYDVSAHVGTVIGDPILSIFYMTSILLLLKKQTWQNLLQPFACVGRMALSNYILQTIICTTIFYSYGLGWYGKIGPTIGVLLTISIYIFQIKLSQVWLRKYRFGPLEWVWRKLTYGNAVKQ